MRLVGAGLVALGVGLGLPPSLQAQENDRSIERIRTELQRRSHLGSSVFTWTEPPPRKLGIVVLVPPVEPGEMVRLRVPIGELVSKAAQQISAANQRRREASARREVQKVLSAFIAQQQIP